MKSDEQLISESMDRKVKKRSDMVSAVEVLHKLRSEYEDEIGLQAEHIIALDTAISVTTQTDLKNVLISIFDASKVQSLGLREDAHTIDLAIDTLKEQIGDQFKGPGDILNAAGANYIEQKSKEFDIEKWRDEEEQEEKMEELQQWRDGLEVGSIVKILAHESEYHNNVAEIIDWPEGADPIICNHVLKITEEKLVIMNKLWLIPPTDEEIDAYKLQQWRDSLEVGSIVKLEFPSSPREYLKGTIVEILEVIQNCSVPYTVRVKDKGLYTFTADEITPATTEEIEAYKLEQWRRSLEIGSIVKYGNEIHEIIAQDRQMWELNGDPCFFIHEDSLIQPTDEEIRLYNNANPPEDEIHEAPLYTQENVSKHELKRQQQAFRKHILKRQQQTFWKRVSKNWGPVLDIEILARKIHHAFCTERKKKGWHAPEDCKKRHCQFCGNYKFQDRYCKIHKKYCGVLYSCEQFEHEEICKNCHDCMRPWDDLDDEHKELPYLYAKIAFTHYRGK